MVMSEKMAEEENEGCELNGTLGVLLQGLLGALAFAVLICKFLLKAAIIF